MPRVQQANLYVVQVTEGVEVARGTFDITGLHPTLTDNGGGSYTVTLEPLDPDAVAHVEVTVEVEVPEEEPSTGTGPYENRNMAELKELARQRDISYSGLNKAELIEALREA